MSPANPAHAHFLVLDFDPRPGLSFFREGRQRFRAEGEGKYFAKKKESLIFRANVARCKKAKSYNSWKASVVSLISKVARSSEDKTMVKGKKQF